ncbi:MAG: hypothetical protein IJQ81_11790 [Oscillibacter sp.]|nr:hypothetical protein [Oscillibacter sp.]
MAYAKDSGHTGSASAFGFAPDGRCTGGNLYNVSLYRAIPYPAGLPHVGPFRTVRRFPRAAPVRSDNPK